MGASLFSKDKVFSAMFGPLPRSPEPEALPPAAAPVVDWETFQAIAGSTRSSNFDGDKWSGGFGPTELLTADYWTLRARSSQLFESNKYARALIRRLVTAEINTGLNLESSPIEGVLGFEEDSLEDWSENVEVLFELWGKDAALCDFRELETFGELQRQIRAEALISGDALIVLQQDQRTGLPRLRVLSGNKVTTPFMGAAKPAAGNRIVQGVELDSNDRHVAFWIAQADGLTWKRLPAWGEKSGRRLAWLYYGTDKRVDDVRGKPILSLVLQALRDLDRYKDATLRKAVVNSILAAFIERQQAGPAALPITSGGGAIRKDAIVENGPDGKSRAWNLAEMIPGAVFEQMAPGETVKQLGSQGIDEKFSEFEAAILAGIAMAYEIPPEIFMLKFASNFSASRAALNEFDAYVFKVRTAFGEKVLSPIYREWMISCVLAGTISARGFLEAWRDPRRQHVLGAWVFCDWSGHIKASVDPMKMVNGFTGAIAAGLTTRDRSSREFSGMKHSRIVRKLKKENEKLAEALEPLEKIKALSKPAPNIGPKGTTEDTSDSSNGEGDDEEPADA